MLKTAFEIWSFSIKDNNLFTDFSFQACVSLSIISLLIDKFSGKLNVFKSQPRYLELMHIEASKTKAIQFLMNQYGILQQEVIAIGDNYNDKEMIKFAGVGVAMGNAPEEIKMVADFVTDTNNDDGVSKALAHFFPQN